jgi:ABC-type bacteriocin/lantibiotic exporter with double-glycine peptidase domain
VKEFWVYTGLRILLFLASLAIVVGVWFLVAGEAPLFWAVIIAFLVSGIGSYFLLNIPRARFAQRVELRAERMTSKIEEMRTKEDADDA